VSAQFLVVPADLFPLRRAGDQETVEHRRHDRVDAVGLQLDVPVVELAVGDDRPYRRDGQRPSGAVELRRVFIEGAVKVPDYCVGVEQRPVVEPDPLAQLEDPARRIFAILLPAGGEPRHELGRPVGWRQIPADQRVIDGVAEKPNPFGALIGRPIGQWNVGHRHRDAQRSLLGTRAARY